MKTQSIILILTSILAVALFPAAVSAQTDSPINTRNMGGPRFGLTYVPGDGQLVEELEHADMGRTISQFGWHFEHQVIPKGGGPQFLIEFVPMLAGVEYSKVIPNFTLAMGLRTPGGWEFGMGPNLVFSKTTSDEVEGRTALLLALGKSFNYGGVSIPVNLAFATSPAGERVSLVFGYAIGGGKSKSKAPDTDEDTEFSDDTEWSTPSRP